MTHKRASTGQNSRNRNNKRERERERERESDQRRRKKKEEKLMLTKERRMGKEAKRKTAIEEEDEAAVTPAKAMRASNMEDLWKVAFPVGTEWDQLDTVYQYNWNFSNLQDAFEEGGKLFGKKVYLFGCTEPQYVPYKGEKKIVWIPAVVAVVSPFPPSDKLGITSVQRATEEIVPMKQMKMEWVPYIPPEKRDRQVERLKSQIYVLSCTQRRAALRHLRVDRLMEYQYCMLYFYQPFKEDELDQRTEVDILFPGESKPVYCTIDWEFFDELEDITNKLTENEDLAEDKKDAFKDFVKEEVRKAKRQNREVRDARRKTLEEMSEETKVAFENMRFYKFYTVQTIDTPDISNIKDRFINRYFGKAHEIL